MVLRRGSKRDSAGRNAGAGIAAASPRAPARRRRDEAPAAPHAGDDAGAEQRLEAEEWVPIWMRKPAWLYLPHLQSETSWQGRPRTEKEDSTGGEAENQCPEAPRPGARDSAVRDAWSRARHHGTPSLRRTAADRDETCSTNLPPSTNQEADIVASHVHGGSGGGTTAAAAIRGRGHSPGPAAATTARGADEVHFIPPHLAISFAQIEEQRVKRRQARGDEAPAATAAERLAALRRRLATRWAAAVPPPARPSGDGCQRADCVHRANADPGTADPPD